MEMIKLGVQQGSSNASVHKQTRYLSTAMTCLQNNYRYSYKPLPYQQLSIAPLIFQPLANQNAQINGIYRIYSACVVHIHSLLYMNIYILILIAFIKYHLLGQSVSMCCCNMFQWHLQQFLCIQLPPIRCKLKYLIDFSNHQIRRKSYCKSKLYL